MKQVNRLHETIFTYYAKHGRTLPWRETTDRYKIMVSEIMLQQTQVSRVIHKYSEWIHHYPTVQDLAQAPLGDVLEHWKGLGYNSRAKRLQDAAKQIVTEYDGVVPNSVEALEKLPGIGPYTARSILIFADNKDVATVDTNIRRIFIAELGIDEQTSDKELFRIAQEVLPVGRSREWHNALMDYGAMKVTSRKSKIRPRTRQGRFKGSKREYRAKLLDDVLTLEQVTVKDAEKKYEASPVPVKEILYELEKEGLIKRAETPTPTYIRP